MKKKNVIVTMLYCVLFFSSILYACSKNNDPVPAATPTDLKIDVQVAGITDATPNGDGSGKVNLTLSGKNVTSFIVTLPTENNKIIPLNASSGTVTCMFTSNPGTTSTYPVNISAYCNTVKKDTAINVTVYCQTSGAGLVWSDEFNGSALDSNIWNYEKGNNNGWGNNEKEYYTSDVANVSVKDGCLQITALYSPNYNNSGLNYTSARITTQNKYSFTYGKVEIRAKVPGDKGTWPALWMLGNNIVSVGWPACGEIDIMEQGTVTGLDNILCSLHWGGDVMRQRNVPGSTTDFHLYSLDWRADHIAFYIDNQLLYSQPNNTGLPFNSNFFFICNVAVGGNMGGNNISLGSSSTMYVDYIRVYN